MASNQDFIVKNGLTIEQIIRDKYAEIQTAINNAETVDEIKTELEKLKKEKA